MIYVYTLKTLFTQLQLCPFTPLYYTDILILLIFNYIHFIHMCLINQKSSISQRNAHVIHVYTVHLNKIFN